MGMILRCSRRSTRNTLLDSTILGRPLLRWLSRFLREGVIDTPSRSIVWEGREKALGIDFQRRVPSNKHSTAWAMDNPKLSEFLG
jgi:hypothetical protein